MFSISDEQDRGDNYFIPVLTTINYGVKVTDPATSPSGSMVADLNGN